MDREIQASDEVCSEVFDALYVLSAPCPDFRVEISIDGNVIQNGGEYDIGQVILGMPVSKAISIKCTGYLQAVVYKVESLGELIATSGSVTINPSESIQIVTECPSIKQSGRNKSTVKVYVAGVPESYSISIEYDAVVEPGNFSVSVGGTEGQEIQLPSGEYPIVVENRGQTSLIIDGVRSTISTNLVNLPVQVEPGISTDIGSIIGSEQQGEIFVYGNGTILGASLTFV